MTEYNIDLAEKVLKSIINNPDKHDQGSWFVTDEEAVWDGKRMVMGLEDMAEDGCGTSACTAGWAVLHDGWKYVEEMVSSESEWAPRRIEKITKGDQTISEPNFVQIGKDLLGLSDEEGRELFLVADETRAIATLYSIVKHNVIPEEFSPDYFPLRASLKGIEENHTISHIAEQEREVVAAELCSAAYAEYEEY